MPKYQSVLQARNAIIAKYDSIHLLGEDYNAMLIYAIQIAMRYRRFILTTSKQELPFLAPDDQLF